MARSKLLRNLSGKEVIKTLCNKFGFRVSRRKGSHVVLVKYGEGKKIVTVVPLHDELVVGTLKGVLELAKVGLEELFEVCSKTFITIAKSVHAFREFI